jgi:hypothetical protein
MMVSGAVDLLIEVLEPVVFSASRDGMFRRLCRADWTGLRLLLRKVLK